MGSKQPIFLIGMEGIPTHNNPLYIKGNLLGNLNPLNSQHLPKKVYFWVVL